MGFMMRFKGKRKADFQLVQFKWPQDTQAGGDD